MVNSCLMSVDGTDFCIPQKGQAKKGTPLEEGGCEDKGEEWQAGEGKDEDEDEGQQLEEEGDERQQRGKRTDEDKA